MIKTTVIGSYPVVGKDIEAIKIAVEDQINAGIEIISDGQTRKDMVSYFSDHIPGFKVENEKTEIIGKIKPPEETPLVEDLLFAKRLSYGKAELKAIITGPMTMIFFSELSPDAPYSGFRDLRLYEDISEALAVEIEIIYKKVGVKYFQIDEPSFSIGAPIDIGRKSIERMISNLKGIKALHVCGNLRKSFKDIVKIENLDVLSFSFKDNISNFDTVERKIIEDYSKKLGLGCVSTMENNIDSIESIKRIIIKGLETYGKENIAFIHPDCGLRPFTREIAFAKLKNMVIALKEVLSHE
ncbi:MAG: methionine synthase [Candidatus Methanomethylicia archaeon]|jgi:5-methyltetrahydropteroyltriglutamate--homocysteine methyltransferase|nr:methionine synthase [Candidatus Methanomethylicia archaeon]